MKILITGGAGFIGSNFAHYWFSQYESDEIVILDKLTYAGNLQNIASITDDSRVKFVQGDIADRDFVNSLFETEKPNIVVNFAAETHVDRSIIGPEVFVMTNIVGTHNLLDAARQNGVQRYHQVSTDEVYGDLGSNSSDFFTESTPLAPNCPYAASKASADLLVRSYFETYAMPVTVSRCSNNYGPYQFPEKLIPYFFRLISQGKQVPVYGDGQNVRDWLFVLDHCRAIDMIIRGGSVGSVYNIGGNNEKTNLEITQFLLNFFGKSEDLIVFVDDRLAHDRRYAIDATKMKEELGWEPSVDFEKGIQFTFDWYQQNQSWVENLMGKLEERRHQRISATPLPTTRT